jgi:hypothetical protein
VIIIKSPVGPEVRFVLPVASSGADVEALECGPGGQRNVPSGRFLFDVRRRGGFFGLRLGLGLRLLGGDDGGRVLSLDFFDDTRVNESGHHVALLVGRKADQIPGAGLFLKGQHLALPGFPDDSRVEGRLETDVGRGDSDPDLLVGRGGYDRRRDERDERQGGESLEHMAWRHGGPP